MAAESTIRSKIVQAFADYWASLPRDETGAVAKADFDPMAIPRLLPYALMFDVPKDGIVRFRLFGSAHVERVGGDLTGKQVSDGTLSDDLGEAMSEGMRLMTETPCGGYLLYRERQDNGRETQLELLALPLSVEGGEGGRLVALSVPLNDDWKLDDKPGAIEIDNPDLFDFVDIGFGQPFKTGNAPLALRPPKSSRTA